MIYIHHTYRDECEVCNSFLYISYNFIPSSPQKSSWACTHSKECKHTLSNCYQDASKKNPTTLIVKGGDLHHGLLMMYPGDQVMYEAILLVYTWPPNLLEVKMSKPRAQTCYLYSGPSCYQQLLTLSCEVWQDLLSTHTLPWTVLQYRTIVKYNVLTSYQ